MADRGYINLLSHLNRAAATLPLETIQASIAHYLAHVQPLPTAFTAIVISSQLFRALSLPKLEALSTAFRHGVHFKFKLLQDEPGGLFSRSMRGKLGEWVHSVLKGLQGGQTMLRLAAYDGLLLGLEDLESEVNAKEGRMRGKVEEELVVALAEAMDMYPLNASSVGWEKEFVPSAGHQTESITLSVAYLIISRSLPLVASHRLKALPLGALTSGLLTIIDSAFQMGTFLSTLGQSLAESQDGKFIISPTSPFVEILRGVSTSPVMLAMAPLSRLCALALSALVDSKPRQGWLLMSEVMQRLESLARNVETDWLKSGLAGTTDDDAITAESQDIAKTMWSTLKTLLFTMIMIVQSVLTTLVYVPQPEPQQQDIHASASPDYPSPNSYALVALHIFSHLSFVLPQFGGVTSTAQNSFVELKKVFYTALDILSSDPVESQRFVRILCEDARAQTASGTLPMHFLHAKMSYSLACIEQLVPILTDDFLRTDVYPMCQPHLSDLSHRETYESSHSVMLAIFAAHAQKAGEGKVVAVSRGEPAFAEQVVPSYVRCLINNSRDGALNTTQLCMAYAALVRSAGAFGAEATESQAGDNLSSSPTPGDAFAWYCIEALLDVIRASSSSSSIASTSTSNPPPHNVDDHLHRLHLTLVATISSVSLTLLPRLLDEVCTVIQSYPTSQGAERDELIQALFKEFERNVGDREKEFVMEWWYEHRDELLGSAGDVISSKEPVLGSGAGENDTPAALTSRL